MKTKTMKLLAAVLAIVACVGILASCGQTNNNETTKNPSEGTTAPTEGTTAPQENVVSVVQSVSETFVNLLLHTPAEAVTDYAALDIATLTATEETDYAYLNSDAVYFKVVNATAEEGAWEDISVGCTVAVITNADGEQEVYIYAEEAEDNTDATGDSTDVTEGNTDATEGNTDATTGATA